MKAISAPAMESDEFSGMLAPEIMDLLFQDADKPAFLALLDRVKRLPENSPLKSKWLRSVEQAMAVKERFTLHQQRERGLLAVIETAQDLTAITDPDRVLQAIVQRARKLVGCDIGYLSIFDHAQGDFYVRATDGAFSEKFKQVRVGLEVGICGFVARTRSPYSSSDYGTDSRFAHSQQIDTAVLDENIVSILGVPLMAGEQVIGVLFVGDRYVRSYVAWEMSILSTLAAHASVAIGNARLFEQAQEALEQAGQTNLLLTRQTAEARVAAEAHEQLTTLVAHGGTLRDICDRVADMLDGRVAVLDEGEQQICCAGTAMPAVSGKDDRASPNEYWVNDQIHFALGESRILGRSVIAYETAGHVCRVSAVVGGRGTLGGLVIHTVTPLSDMAVRIFERSSMIAGVVFLSQERRESTSQAELSAVLRALISAPQPNPAQLSSQAARYGLDLSAPVCITVIQLAPENAGYLLERLDGTFKSIKVLSDAMDDSLIFLCNADAAETLKQLLMQYFHKRQYELVTGVISDPVCSISGLPQAHLAVRRCLVFLQTLGRQGSLFREHELSLYSILFKNQDRHDIALFLASTLLQLYRGDDPRKIELARTLLAYLDCGHNARGAAKSLDIHINTLHQRLDSVHSLLADWRVPGRVLDIHMALRLWRLADEQAFPAVTIPKYPDGIVPTF